MRPRRHLQHLPQWLLVRTSVLCSVILLAPSVVGAQQARERQLLVTVLDSAGAPVTGLGPADFIVREDDVTREVLSVRRATMPMQIAVLVDTSTAATTHMGEMRDAVARFADALQGEHEFTLISFGERPTIRVEPTTDRERFKAGVFRLLPVDDSGQVLLEAIVETARGFEKREATHPVLVVVATEGDEFSNQHYLSVLEALEESGTRLYALELETNTSDPLDSATQYRGLVLSSGPERTGGRWVRLLTDTAFADRLEDVAVELSNQHLVEYARPEMLIPPDDVEVTTRRDDWTTYGALIGVR